MPCKFICCLHHTDQLFLRRKMWMWIWKGSTAIPFGLSKSFSTTLLWNPYPNYNQWEAQILQQDLLFLFWASKQIPRVRVRHTTEQRTCWWRSQGCEGGGEKNAWFQTSTLTFLLQNKYEEVGLDIPKHWLHQRQKISQASLLSRENFYRTESD